MFYDDDLGTENIFFPSLSDNVEYASFTINVYLYSIHLGIWNVTAVFQFPFNFELSYVGLAIWKGETLLWIINNITITPFVMICIITIN